MKFMIVSILILFSLNAYAETITTQSEADDYNNCLKLRDSFNMGYMTGVDDQKVNTELLKCAEEAQTKYPHRIWPIEFKRSSYTIKNKKSLEALNEMLPMMPKNPVIYDNIGLWHLRNDLYSEAIINFKKAMKLDPKGCYGGDLAETYLMLGVYDKAIEEYNRHLKSCPEDWLAYEKLGRSHFKKGNIKKAKTNFLRSCEMGYEFSCNQLKSVNKSGKLYVE